MGQPAADEVADTLAPAQKKKIGKVLELIQAELWASLSLKTS